MNRASIYWPLRVHLRDPIDAVAVNRMWQRIEEREKARRRGARNGLYGIAAAAAMLILVLCGVHQWGKDRGRCLVTESGAPFVELVAPRHAARSQRFVDGSTIEAGPGTVVRGLSSSAQEFSVLLERGTIDVSVVPGGPRRWVVEAKVARIEVMGTQFSATRHTNDEVTIAVKEGVVLVRSAALPQGIERLAAGRSLWIPPPTTSDHPQLSAASSTDATSAASSSDATLPGDAVPMALPPHVALPVGTAARTASSASNSSLRQSASGLMQQADRARLAGDTAQAERSLERLVREFPSDSQAAIGAYTLAVVRIQRDKTQAAVDALRLALALRPPSSVQQDCYLRLVETELAIGQRGRAIETAREYRQKFPNGRYRRALAALLDAPGDRPAL
jgi:TolA-binding protein